MRMTSLQQLYNETTSMAAVLDTISYEELEKLIDQRDQVLKQLAETTLIVEEDRELIRALVQYDESIIQRMADLRDEASSHLQKANVSRMQRRAYDTHIDDGAYFYDKRK